MIEFESILDLRKALTVLDEEELRAVDLVYFNPPPSMLFESRTGAGRPHNGLYRDVAFVLYPEKGEGAAIAKLHRVLTKAYSKLRQEL